MKSKVRLTTAILIISSMCGSMAYAGNLASCDNDVYQMAVQINQYGSITSVDKQRVNQVLSARQSGANKCFANGYEYGYFVCALKWEMGNWGNTLHC